MFEIVFLAVLAYSNSLRAKKKGKSPVLWGFITVGAYMSALIIGLLVVIVNFCKDVVNINQLSSLDSSARDIVSQQLQQAISGNPLHLLTVELFGIGGFLLVRYVIDKNPDKKGPEVHWMDRMGEQ